MSYINLQAYFDSGRPKSDRRPQTHIQLTPGITLSKLSFGDTAPNSASWDNCIHTILTTDSWESGFYAFKRRHQLPDNKALAAVTLLDQMTRHLPAIRDMLGADPERFILEGNKERVERIAGAWMEDHGRPAHVRRWHNGERGWFAVDPHTYECLS